MQTISLRNMERAVKAVAGIAIENESYFSELDAAAGDGDFGVSLATGFRKLLDTWQTLDRSSISALLVKVGTTITSNVGGCSGPIWGTAFLRAGLAAKGKEKLTLGDLATMGRAATEGIMARGGARQGDKTLLDALVPAIEKIEQFARERPEDCLGAVQAAAEAATAAIESTKGWEAKRGRQSFVGERSKGTIDPGIVAVATVMRAAVQALSDNED